MSHAGELETALMMHLHPELVKTELIQPCPPATGNEWFAADFLTGARKYTKYRPFNTFNDDGHIGQPHLATQEKGKIYFDIITEELARFFDHAMIL